MLPLLINTKQHYILEHVFNHCLGIFAWLTPQHCRSWSNNMRGATVKSLQASSRESRQYCPGTLSMMADHLDDHHLQCGIFVRKLEGIISLTQVIVPGVMCDASCGLSLNSCVSFFASTATTYFINNTSFPHPSPTTVDHTTVNAAFPVSKQCRILVSRISQSTSTRPFPLHPCRTPSTY